MSSIWSDVYDCLYVGKRHSQLAPNLSPIVAWMPNVRSCVPPYQQPEIESNGAIRPTLGATSLASAPSTRNRSDRLSR